MSPSPLDAGLDGIVGSRTAKAFHRAFGLETVGDLLSHYPRRYAHRGELTSLTRLPRDENVTIVAEVRQVRERTMRARRGSILEVSISDGAGFLTLTFFNQAWRGTELVPGARGIFAGKVSEYRGTLQLAHPDYELFDSATADPESSAEAKRWAETPIPIYPATASLASWQIQKAMAVVLDGLGDFLDPIPGSVRASRQLLPVRRAWEWMHRPSTDEEAQAARETLRFHEAFILQAALLQQRADARVLKGTARVARPGGLRDRLDRALPFALTTDQERVGDEIAADMAHDYPMNRLVQGEVGSGKTLVALRAALAVSDSGGQSAFLAPTEVLAVQHFNSIVDVLGPEVSATLMPVLLTGQQSQAERKKVLLRIVSGHARIVVGTHALLSDAVMFCDLGLVIVDEQHRFGVAQREALRLKARRPPHVLVLTATPIPRTVAMTVFGDLDVSTIRQLPAGRMPIESFVVPLAEHPSWESRVWERLSEEIALGRQGFVVCPAIDSNETEDGVTPETFAPAETPLSQLEVAGTADTQAPTEFAPTARVETPTRENASASRAALSPVARTQMSSVSAVLETLRAHPALDGRRIEAMHGRLVNDEKRRIMDAFRAGEIDILVATTVIEVGVDVPNASTMVVCDADRFGVSQLHQLRGRIGRGAVPGLCLLVTKAKPGSLARERVDVVAATSDGFALAQADLELRHEGDVLGRIQSGGVSSLRLLRVASDGELIADARACADTILTADPELAGTPALREAIVRRLDEDSRMFLSTA